MYNQNNHLGLVVLVLIQISLQQHPDTSVIGDVIYASAANKKFFMLIIPPTQILNNPSNRQRCRRSNRNYLSDILSKK